MPRRTPSAIALAIVALLLALPAVATAAPSWGDPFVVSEDAGDAEVVVERKAAVADASGRVTQVWLSCDDRCRVLARSRGASGTWGPIQTVSDAGAGGYGYDLTAAGNAAGAIAVVWREPTTGADYRVLGAYRAAGESAWTEQVLSTRTGPHVLNPGNLAVSGEGLATVAWYSSAGEDGYAVQAVQFDATTKTAPEDVSDTSYYGDAQEPQVVAGTDGRATIVYADQHQATEAEYCYQEVLAARETDAGFAAPVRVNLCAGAETAVMPNAAPAPDGGVLVVYNVETFHVGGRMELEGAVLPADGSAFERFVVSPDDPYSTHSASSRTYDVVTDPATGAAAVAYATYGDAPGGDYEPKHRVLVVARDGATGAWSTPHLLGGPYSGVADPEVRLAFEPSGDLVAAFSLQGPGGTGDQTEFFTARRSAGTWGPTQLLHTAAGGVHHPDGVDLLAGPGATVLSWVRRAGADYLVEAIAASDATVDQAPVAAFTHAPAAPKAGETVTFTSTSTDPESRPLDFAWDLDDDGAFDDGSTATVSRAFPAAGTYTVELQVTDAGDTTRTATKQVVVTAAATSGGTGGAGTGTGGTGGTGNPQQPIDLPSDFVPTQLVDTSGARSVPKVVSRPLDEADAKVLRALVHVDIRHERVLSPEGKLPKGKRGKWEIGDVVGQSLEPGTAVTTSIGAPAAITLRFWAGDKADRKRCDELRAEVRGDDLQTGLDQLKAAGCRVPDVTVKASSSAGDPTVTKVAKDGDLTVKVPTEPEDLDITTWKRHGPVGNGNPGPEQGSFTLTAGQKNAVGVLLLDRANRKVDGARVRFDLSDVGGRDVTVPTSAAGIAAAGVDPERAGVVHVFSEWADSKGERLYGYARFKVVERCDRRSFVSTIGETWVRQDVKGGCAFRKGTPTTARAAGVAEFFSFMREALVALGGATAAAVQQAATATEGVVTTAKRFGVSATQLWNGLAGGSGAPQHPTLTRATSGIWFLGANGVVAAGGANVVAAGGANVVAAGGANVVAAGGLNLISDNGLGVIAAGGGNIVSLPDGSRVVAPGGANLISDNGLGVVAAGGANLIGPAAGN